jgi:hypothetical protein
MAKSKEELDLIPRVSVLEMSQQAIQRDLSNLTHSVQKQGEQLTLAITQLSHAQNSNYNALAEKIGVARQTDWPTLLTAVGLIIMIVGGLMTHVYTQFNYVDKEQTRIHDRLILLEQTAIDNKVNIAGLKSDKH